MGGFVIYHKDANGRTNLEVVRTQDEARESLRWWSSLYVTWYPAWYYEEIGPREYTQIEKALIEEELKAQRDYFANGGN